MQLGIIIHIIFQLRMSYQIFCEKNSGVVDSTCKMQVDMNLK